MYALNVDFTGSSTTGGQPTITMNGQLMIGSAVLPNIQIGTITSSSLTVGYSMPNITLETHGGGSPIETISLNIGTSPISPDGSGNIVFNGSVVPAGTAPVQTYGFAAHTMNLEVQLTQAIASTDATKVGLASFNSADFNVDANGFVSSVGGASFAYTNVTFGDSPYTVLSTDYYLSLDTSGGAIILLFPNAPTTTERWVVKDRTGNATANNIQLTTVGGAVTLDGLTSQYLAGNFSSVELLFNATSYELF